MHCNKPLLEACQSYSCAWNRFSGSTLQVMGVTPSDGQWAISGGTGEFALAHGIIKQKVVQGNADENVKELHVHAFYTPMNTSVVSDMSWILFIPFCSSTSPYIYQIN